MRKIVYLLLLFCFCGQKISAQTNTIDSLLSLLDTVKQDTNTVRIYEQIFKKYYRPAPNTAIEYGKKGLELAKKINDNKGISNLSNNIGVVSYFQSNYSQALEYYGISLETAIKLKDSLGISKSYTNFGVVYFAISAYKEAIQYYDMSYEIKEKLADSLGMAKIKNNLGTIYYENGDFAKALENFLVSLKIKQKQGDADGEAQSYINIASLYEKQKNLKTAFEFYENALELYQKTGNTNGIASAYTRIGNFYNIQKKFKAALAYYEKAMQIAIKNDNKTRIIFVKENIADVYTNTKQFEKAIKEYSEALVLAKKVKSFKNIITIQTEIANIYNLTKKPKKALLFLNECEKLGTSKLTLVQNKQIYKAFLSAYARLGDADNADKYIAKFEEAHDSLFTENQTKIVSNMQVKYETGKKQKEIELLTKDALIKEKEKQAQKAKIILLFGGIGALLIFVVIAMFSLRVRRQANVQLNNKNMQLQQHREEIIAQNDELQTSKEEIEVHLEEISLQHEVVIAQKKHITDSIVYAQRIQQAAFPDPNLINELFADNFILYKPRDIVSGDFYWMKEIIRGEDIYKVVAVADCTGHGVPGAFVSMLGISFLNELIRRPDITSAAQLLDQLRGKIKIALKQTAGLSGSKDGMDIALTIINSKDNSLEFAGAYNPLYIIRNINNFNENQFNSIANVAFYNLASTPESTLIEIKSDRQPIGIYRKESPFTNTRITLEKNDLLYLFSDGFIDQFHKVTGEKFKNIRFKKTLLSNSGKNLSEQKNILNSTFNNWKGNSNQIDDVLVLGIKI